MLRTCLPLAAILLAVTVSPAADIVTARGTVVSVDPGRLTLTTADGTRLTLKSADATTVLVDGKAGKLSDLGPGQRVRVTYRPADGGNQLVSVTARKTTAADVAREAREALQAAGRYTYQQKDQYEQKLRGVVDDLDDRIDELQHQAAAATQDARKKLEQQISDLKQKRGVVEERLAKVRSAGAAAWDDVKTGVRNAVEDLRRSLDGIRPDGP